MHDIPNISNMYISNPSNFNISNYIDKVFYINLEHRTDRRQEIEGELNNFNIPYERFNAYSTPEFGIVGCTKSHLEVLKEQINRSPFPFPRVHIKNIKHDINDYNLEDIELCNYKTHEPIKMEMRK